MNNDYPTDDAMLCLLGLHLGDCTEVAGGVLVLVIDGRDLPGGQTARVVVSLEALDTLESRGWIDTNGDMPRITGTGTYWIEKWMNKKLGKGRISTRRT